MTQPQPPAPTVFILFGATGDLAARMVLPAFATLAAEGLLPERWRLVGNGRGDVSHLDFRAHVKQVIDEHGPHLDEAAWADFAQHLLFAGGGFDESDPGSLLDVITEAEKEVGADRQLVHYLALPPSVFATMTQSLANHGLTDGARVVYEKPFGTSPKGFRELDQLVHSVFEESAVYRIDHFLGKEATQDLHVLRFGNTMLGAMWSREHVRAVQIDVPETLDVANRAEFYDATGALLDMIVTHLFQLAAEVAMEPPVSLDAADLQDAREGVIAAFRPLSAHDVVLGQFRGYRELAGIDPNSPTDTFAALRLWVDTERWHGVPFLLRTGKRLAVSEQRVSLLLRKPSDGPLTHIPDEGNVLSLSLAGDGAIDLSLVVKHPGADSGLASGVASLAIDKIDAADPLPPYSRLLHDVLLGDRALFTRPDGLADTWAVVEPILADRPQPVSYEPGSMGPAAALELAAPDGWLVLGTN